MLEAKALARSRIHEGSLEPSPHADLTRTIISRADLFIVKRLCDFLMILSLSHMVSLVRCGT